MKYIGLLAAHLSMLVGVSAQDCPVSVRLEGQANAQGFPVLFIHLARQQDSLGKIHVRFPEAIDAKSVATGANLKYYQDIRSPEWPAKLQCEPHVPVKWTGDESDTGYIMTLDNGMTLKARATFVKNEVKLCYSLTNATDTALTNIRIWSCVQLHAVPELGDALMQRTSVPLSDGYKLMREQIAAFQAYATDDAAKHRFHGYMKGVSPFWKENPSIFPHPGHPDDPTKAVHFWRVPDPITRCAIATTSRDGTWTVRTTAEKAPCVWTNPGISCHHADPVGNACGVGETIIIRNRVQFLYGGRSELSIDKD